MFDIGFSKLLLIALVALVVLGPDRLPKLARTAGHLFGRLQRYVATVKADINREMQTSDLQKVKEDFQAAAKDIQQSVNATQTEVQTNLRSIEADYAAPTAAATAFTTAPAEPIMTGEAALLEMHASSLPADYLPPVKTEALMPTLSETGLQRFDLGLEPLRVSLKATQPKTNVATNAPSNTPSNGILSASEPQLAAS